MTLCFRPAIFLQRDGVDGRMPNGMLSRANGRAIALSSSPGATHHPDQTSARTDHTTHPGNNLQESLRPREGDERFRNFRSLLGLGRDSTIRSREWPRQTHFQCDLDHPTPCGLPLSSTCYNSRLVREPRAVNRPNEISLSFASLWTIPGGLSYGFSSQTSPRRREAR